MTWEVSDPTPDRAYVRVEQVGSTDAEQMRAALTATLASCDRYETYRVLTDISEQRADHTVVDLFDLVGRMTGLDTHGHAFRNAVLIGTDPDPEAAELARFFETTAVNRGVFVRVFDDAGPAVTWLLR